MIWKFIKSNWFSIALVLLVAMAVARRGLRINFGGSAAPEPRELSRGKNERFTEDKTLADAEKPSQLGLSLPESAHARKALPAVDDATAVAYLRRFGNVAVGERKKFRVPASVLLALSYVNSFSGTRETAKQANNFFTLPCSPEFEGQTATIDGGCYRRYDTAWESFRDFSIYLAAQEWLGPMRSACGQDWRLWVPALAKQDVSDVENFEAEMTKVIQSYRLYELDAR
jgi:hypothetical protein